MANRTTRPAIRDAIAFHFRGIGSRRRQFLFDARFDRVQTGRLYRGLILPLDFAIVKRHPAATVGVVVGTVAIVYLATRNKSGASSPSASGVSSDLVAANSGTSVAAQAYNAQIVTAQLGAQVAVANTNAALTAQKDNNATAIDLARITTGATTTQAQIVSDSNTMQTLINANAGTEIAHTNADAATEIATTVSNAQVATAVANASAYTSSTRAVTELAATLAAGNKRSSTGVAQIISAVQGQGPQAIAANQPSAVAGSPASIIGAIAKPVTSLLSKIF